MLPAAEPLHPSGSDPSCLVRGRIGADELQSDVPIKLGEQVRGRRMIGLQHRPQPGLTRHLRMQHPLPVPRHRLQLRGQRRRPTQRPPMPMLIPQRVSQHERIEAVRLRRQQPVPFPGPGRNLWRHAEQRHRRQGLQKLHQQPLRAFDRHHHLDPKTQRVGQPASSPAASWTIRSCTSSLPPLSRTQSW